MTSIDDAHAHRESAQSETLEQASANAVPIQTVLYVEDHPVNVLLMQALFSKCPQAHLVVATNGEDGMRAAAARLPDLLLLDLRLPDCHGTELLHRLRALPGLADVPAVAVTAEDTAGVSECGFGEIWHKPMDMQATLRRLDLLLAAPTERSALRMRSTRARSAPEQMSFPAAPTTAAPRLPGSR